METREGEIIIAVKGMVRRMDGRVLIVQRSDIDPIGPGTFEFPGGKIDFGESAEAALIREVREETGLMVEIDQMLYVTSFLTGPLRQVFVIAYLCHPVGGSLQLSFEHQQSLWAGRAEAEEKLLDSIVTDLKKNQVLSLIGPD